MNKFKLIIPRQILILTILVVLSIFVFTIVSDSDYFIYLIWNMFLAFLPFLVSSILLWYRNKEKKNFIVSIIGVFLWLILFPNTIYLVTDIIHLGANALVPLWFDVFLLFSCAWIGVYLGIYSLFHVEQLLLPIYGKKNTNIIILLIIFLSSFGIYLGRFLRWNSWDVFIQPKHIFNDVFYIFSNPLNHKEMYLTTIVFFLFITISYNVWKYVHKR